MATTYKTETALGYFYTYHISDTTTLLNGALTSAAVTTITVDDTTAFSTSGILQIENEKVRYTGKTATTFTGCTRGSEGSVRAAHADNTSVYQGVYSSNKGSSTAFDYFTDDAKVNDCFMFCYTSLVYPVLEDLKLYIGTAFAATSVTFAWELSQGDNSEWRAMTYSDESNGFKETGEKMVLFEMADNTRYGYGYTWAATYVNGQSYLRWMRCRITAINAPTEGGAQSTQTIKSNLPIITCTGTGNTFTTLHTADLAGTQDLLKATIETSPQTFTLGHPVKPLEQGAIKLIISCTARAGATCDVAGTDSEDGAITETGLDISSGAATSAKCFKTVSSVVATGLTDGDDFDVSQGRWGVVSKMDNNFLIYRQLTIGDGSTATTFVDTDKNIAWLPRTSYVCWVADNATLTLGQLDDLTTKSTSHGCKLYIQVAYPYGGITKITATSATALMYFYSCSLSAYTPGGDGSGISSADRIWNCNASYRCGLNAKQGLTVSGCYNNYNGATLYGQGYSSGFNDGGSFFYNQYCIYWYSNLGEDSYNCIFKAPTTSLIISLGTTVVHSMINPTYDTMTITWSGAGPWANINEKYTMDLKVVDEGNVAISGATVVLKDKDGTQSFSTTTDASGLITQQTVTRGYYAQTNGNTITDANPFTLTISKSGYLTKTMKFTLTTKFNQVEKLEKTKTLNLSKRIMAMNN
jgi:hypothetical protein